MKTASLIIYMFDLVNESATEILQEVNRLENSGKPFVGVGNKIDKADSNIVTKLKTNSHFVFISASEKQYIEVLKDKIIEMVNLNTFKTGNTIVTNIRHYENLLQTRNALKDVLTGLGNNVTGDFLAMDIRQALHYLGEITGEITTDDLLDNIFSKFCIGK
ncbi:MAG: tRNA uridine-5-carboxymethylaminomethyl(34) synthesis GTPase MnmE, partial [Cyclobacteriaceae bacterium]|nr:tRNA uridine-5-carboxymethylaminomethyl(34) synthesis GTPase MnmE [Cyclobacteriaceae bacterium]